VANVERLKLIQSLIERMARNSFALKGWTVTVVAALLGLAAHQSDRRFALIAIYASRLPRRSRCPRGRGRPCRARRPRAVSRSRISATAQATNLEAGPG